MNQTEWITRTRNLLNLPQPFWIVEVPHRVDRPLFARVKQWFRSIPNAVAALFVGVWILRHQCATRLTNDAMKIGFQLMNQSCNDLRIVEFLLPKLRPSDLRTSNLLEASYQFLDGAQRNGSSRAFSAAFETLILFRYRHLLQRRIRHSDLEEIEDFTIARELWNSPTQQLAFRGLQSVFLPPESFQPTTPDEWLIAADMLEEAGEVRAEAIRAAVNGASEEGIFKATYKALPPDLLRES